MSGRAASRYVVGIDLGTTHTVVAYAPADGASPTQIFEIEQPIAEGIVERRPLLPSCLYAPLAGEAADPRARAPGPATAHAFGAYAKTRGAEVAGRLVTSAKSWLPSAHVDRTAAILPWGERDEGDDAPRLSPVDASAAYLAIVRRAWDDAHPDAHLADQEIVLTVPASFDDAARSLTLEAARRAGIAVSLLEEPQAAFYDVLQRLGVGGLSAMFPTARDTADVLVCDVGGGTTDFSRIALSRRGSDVRRVAVGDHLLLGGDNMDLAVAMLAERRLAGDKLTPARFALLVQEARRAKERALSAAPPEELSLSVLGTGSSLIGGARRATLQQSEIEALVLDGFFPVVDAAARPATGKSALVSFGLPYARDAAITKHLAAFLASSAGATWPTHLLLCGGVFHASRVAVRVRDVLQTWAGRPVELLPGVDPDLAVARGAVAHGLARRGLGTRIGGGAARAYYLLAPRADGVNQAICVLPKGSEPGQTHAIDASLTLTKGKNVRIDVAASMGNDTSGAGSVVAFDPDRFARLPPLVAKVDGVGEQAVKLEGQLSDIGTLSLSCVEPSGARHVLELDLRPARDGASVAPPSMPPPTEGRLAPAIALLDGVFGRDGKPAKDVVRDLSKMLGERATWGLPVLRALGDALLDRAKGRRRSAEHERVLLNLASYCLRPGVGHPDDVARMDRFFSILSEGLIHSREPKVAEQWLIATRRVAMGLDEARQQASFAALEPVLLATSTKKPKSPFAEHETHVLELAAALERLAPATKEGLGHTLVERVWVKKDPLLFRVIGRLGARLPTYASAHLVIRTKVAEGWLDELRRERWESSPALPVAAADLARRTGDRARDVSDKVRDDVARRLSSLGRDDLAELVREIVEARADDREAALGDALPPGLSFAG